MGISVSDDSKILNFIWKIFFFYIQFDDIKLLQIRLR